MEKRLAYSYGRALALTRLAIFGFALVFVGLVLVLAPLFPPLPTAFFMALLALAAVVFAVSPLMTQHWLTRSRLILRQGWYFRAILPFSEIVSLTAADDSTPLRAPLGIHRPLGQPTLFVTGGRTGLLILRLARPRRFWSSFGLEADQIVFDAKDREGLLRAYAERRNLLPPVEPDRSGADLRD
jgi:hypothetical protein